MLNRQIGMSFGVLSFSVLFYILVFGIVLDYSFAWEYYGKNPIVTAGDIWCWAALSDPSIIYIPGGDFYAVYTAAGIDSGDTRTLTRPGAAWSSDGFNWTMSDAPVMTNGEPGAWDSAAVETPAIFWDGDSIIMIYAGDWAHGSGDLALGIASSTDGGMSFHRLADGPIFQRDTTRPEEYRSIESPTFLRIGDSLVMWYNGVSIDWHITVCRASSPDGIVWNRYPGNPVLDIGAPGDFDEIGVYSPSVRFLRDSLCMIYQGLALGDSGYRWDSTSLGWATSSDGGITWTKYLDNPVLVPNVAGAWDETGPKTPSFCVYGSSLVIMYWNGGSFEAISGLGIATHTISGIFEKEVYPKKINISVFPNPFNSSCKISVESHNHAFIPTLIEIYDIRGNVVATLYSARAGKQNRQRIYIWTPDASISSGLYFVRVTGAERTISRRILYLK